jgi:hypothetical protein
MAIVSLTALRVWDIDTRSVALPSIEITQFQGRFPMPRQ